MTPIKRERNRRVAADRARPTAGRSDRLAAIDGGAGYQPASNRVASMVSLGRWF